MVKITVKLPASVFSVRGSRRGRVPAPPPPQRNFFQLRVHYKLTKYASDIPWQTQITVWLFNPHPGKIFWSAHVPPPRNTKLFFKTPCKISRISAYILIDSLALAFDKNACKTFASGLFTIVPGITTVLLCE